MRDKNIKSILDAYYEAKSAYNKAKENYDKCVKSYQFLMKYRIGPDVVGVDRKNALCNLSNTRHDAADVCKEAKENLKNAQQLLSEVAVLASKRIHIY